MKAIAARSDYIFIVEKDGKYYLVNLETQQATLADPPDSPDMFLKFGYFKFPDGSKLNDNIKTAIRKVMDAL